MIPENIIISRTDSIGDVVLTLPMAKFIKEKYPSCKIAFLGKEYTKPVIKACTYIDQFISLNDFMNKKVMVSGEIPEYIIHVFPHRHIARRAKELKIKWRIGTRNRFFHWTTCNKLVKLSRRNSSLHESQLNIKLLQPIGIDTEFELNQIGQSYGLQRIQPLSPALSRLIDPYKYNVILHPKSQGNGREWGLENFIRLVKLLDAGRYQIFITGTAKERLLLNPLFEAVGDRVKDITGEMDLYQFMAFIKNCDGMVASGTGPLHIAAALGKDALGIFPPIRPIHPGRWAPLGPGAEVFVQKSSCNDCAKNPLACHCIAEVNPATVAASLEKKFLLNAGSSHPV
jgi:ADP-heptose:LPS heptosyltransferase